MDPGAPVYQAVDLASDGPDEMGRELAEGPAAAEGTLGEVDRMRPEIAALAAESGRTVLIGTGASLAVGRAAVPSWRRRMREANDRRWVAIRESTAVALRGVDGEAFEAADLVIAISQSGSSPETLAAARIAFGAGCRVVALTAERSSPLAALADLAIVTPSGLEEGAATKSALSALTALYGISGELDTDPYSRATLGRQLGSTVADWASVAAFGAPLAEAGRLWVVGLGTALGVAASTGLLWHEKVRRPAVAVSVSEFRHGPVEAARAGDAVLLLDVDPPDESRERYLDLLRSELRRLDVGLVEVSVDPPADARGLRLTSRPGGPAALEGLLRVQQLVRAAAHATGTYQDGFRVLRAIVTAAPVFGEPDSPRR